MCWHAKIVEDPGLVIFVYRVCGEMIANASEKTGLFLSERGRETEPRFERNIFNKCWPLGLISDFIRWRTFCFPVLACRCLYLGVVELDAATTAAAAADADEGLMRAVDALIPGPVLQATACDQLGADSPVQYTECHLQAAHNEGILLTDLSRKLFFQRHFSVNSFVHAGVDPRHKA